jgi:hypothetical protein
MMGKISTTATADHSDQWREYRMILPAKGISTTHPYGVMHFDRGWAHTAELLTGFRAQ